MPGGWSLEQAYWTYIPDPPWTRSVTWGGGKPLPVLVNDSQILGQPEDNNLAMEEKHQFTYVGMSSTHPICFASTTVNGCVRLTMETKISNGEQETVINSAEQT